MKMTILRIIGLEEIVNIQDVDGFLNIVDREKSPSNIQLEELNSFDFSA